jgi:hypothetical protein
MLLVHDLTKAGMARQDCAGSPTLMSQSIQACVAAADSNHHIALSDCDRYPEGRAALCAKAVPPRRPQIEDSWQRNKLSSSLVLGAHSARAYQQQQQKNHRALQKTGVHATHTTLALLRGLV